MLSGLWDSLCHLFISRGLPSVFYEREDTAGIIPEYLLNGNVHVVDDLLFSFEGAVGRRADRSVYGRPSIAYLARIISFPAEPRTLPLSARLLAVYTKPQGFLGDLSHLLFSGEGR